MAILISIHYSASKMLNMARRHIRLCKKAFNAENLINQIKPLMNALIASLSNLQLKQEAYEDALDDRDLLDNVVDNDIQTLFEKCNQYDREHPGDLVKKKIFPGETFGDIVRLPYSDEANAADAIVTRLKSLGSNHEIFVLAQPLNEKIAEYKIAIKDVENSTREISLAKAELEIAKETLQRQYEVNYLDARRIYGKKQAELLFPKFRKSNKMEEIETEVNEQVETVSN